MKINDSWGRSMKRNLFKLDDKIIQYSHGDKDLEKALHKIKQDKEVKNNTTDTVELEKEINDECRIFAAFYRKDKQLGRKV